MRAIRKLFIVGTVMGAFVIVSCGNSNDEMSPSPPESGTVSESDQVTPELISPDEPYANASLAELGDAADLVVQGLVTEIKHGIKLGNVTSMSYRQYDVKRTSVRGPSEVQIFVSETSDGVSIAYENQAILEVGDEAIWVLDELDPKFGMAGFVLTASNSIFPVVDGEIQVSDQFDAGREAAALAPEDVLKKLGTT